MAIAYKKRFIVFGTGRRGGIDKVGEADTLEQAEEIMKKISKSNEYIGVYKVDMKEHMSEELIRIDSICNSVEDGILGTYGKVITKDEAYKQLEKAASIYKGMKESMNKDIAKTKILNAEGLLKTY